jgi:hypothetical protein
MTQPEGQQNAGSCCRGAACSRSSPRGESISLAAPRLHVWTSGLTRFSFCSRKRRLAQMRGVPDVLGVLALEHLLKDLSFEIRGLGLMFWMFRFFRGRYICACACDEHAHTRVCAKTRRCTYMYIYISRTIRTYRTRGVFRRHFNQLRVPKFVLALETAGTQAPRLNLLPANVRERC